MLINSSWIGGMMAQLQHCQSVTQMVNQQVQSGKHRLFHFVCFSGTDYGGCYSGWKVDACGKGYDFESVMHYDL